jgi:hypothetical protein
MNRFLQCLGIASRHLRGLANSRWALHRWNHKLLFAAALVAAASGSAGATRAIAAGKYDTLVVCPPALRSGLDRWLEYRRGQGRTIQVIESGTDAAELQGKIHTEARLGTLRTVVLVGDATAAAGTAPAASRTVPTFLLPAKVNIHFNSEPELASDHPYVDLDEDGVPDLAIGRIAADSADELAAIVDKTIAYEQSDDFTNWRRQVNFVAGLGGFSPMADKVLELTAKRFITAGLPSAYAISMTYGSWRSPYCPDPREFHATTIDRLNEGCVFWVYIGHGHRSSLDRVRCGSQQYHIFDQRDVPKANSAHGLPIALFLACHTAAFDDARDCLAEDLLRTPRGPVAVIGGTRVTMPYGMSIMANELMTACFQTKLPTLGEVVLEAKRQMLTRPRDDDETRSLDALARLVNPKSRDLALERAEQVLLFHLIGDPLLRLPFPTQATLDVPSQARPGEALQVVGESPVAGEAVVELVVRRDKLKFRPAVRDVFSDSDEALRAYQDDYQRANDPRLASTRQPVAAGPFQAELRVPDDAQGECHVRLYVTGKDGCAVAARDLVIERPASPPDAGSSAGK